jgi:hypothetical protein
MGKALGKMQAYITTHTKGQIVFVVDLQSPLFVQQYIIYDYCYFPLGLWAYKSLNCEFDQGLQRWLPLDTVSDNIKVAYGFDLGVFLIILVILSQYFT